MSKFSEYLKFLLEQNGESISSVARKAGIERTSIHKALSDRRVLAYKAVQKLSEYLQLTLDENAELFRLYNMLLQGENAYASRQEMVDLFRELAALHPETAPVLPECGEAPKPADILHGKLAVCLAVREILLYEAQWSEEAEIDLYLPPALYFVEDFISLWRSGKKLRVSHLLGFSQNPGSKLANIEDIRLLRQVIPFCLYSDGQYLSYYYYDQPSAAPVNPFCRYMVTPRYLVLMTEDFSAAQIHSAPPLVSHYRRHFQSLLSRCHVLSRQICLTDPVEQEGCLFCGSHPTLFGARPFSVCFPQKNHAGDGEASLREDCMVIFTEEGLWDFAADGVLPELCSGKIRTLCPHQKEAFVTNLRQKAEEGQVCVTNPLHLSTPSNIAVCSDLEDGLWIFFRNSGSRIRIAEKGICHAFCDFFGSLSGSYLVRSREETLRLLDRVLECLRMV